MRARRLHVLPCLLGMIAAAACGSGLEAQSYPGVPAEVGQVPVSSSKAAPSSNALLATVPEDLGRSPVAAGYLLRLDIFGAPEMGAELRVDESGKIVVPFLGPIQVAGKTPVQAQAEISDAYVTRSILKNPQVTLSVLQYSTGNVSVMGEVQTPGRVQLFGPRTLEDVLAMAGGETLAAGNLIEVYREGAPPSLIHYAQGTSPEPLRRVTVQRGDSVYVWRAGVIYVLGAVNRPGGYLMVDRGQLNVLQAVSLALGTTLVATTGKFYIIRSEEPGTYKQIVVPYKDMAKGKAAPMALSVNDILYVPTSTTKSLLINGSGLIGTAATAAIYRTP